MAKPVPDSSAPWRLGHRPGLDGLRGAAILLVLAWHVGLPGLPGAGQAGVTLFFVLSGFLITTLLVDERVRAGRIDFTRFYLRRAARLLPALLLLLVAVTIMVLIVQPPGGAVAILASILYTANWVQASHGDLFPIQHTWTLSIEEQFYVAWPLLLSLLLLIRRRWALSVVLLAFVASTALRFFFAPFDEARALWGTDVRADALLAGCALALVMTRPIRVRQTLTIVALLAFGAAVVTGSPPMLLAGGLTVISLASVLLVLSATTTHGLLAWAPLRWVGSISYGLYLWHPFLFNAFPAVPHVVLVVPAVLAAVASSRWVEQPIIRWARNRSVPRPAVLAA